MVEYNVISYMHSALRTWLYIDISQYLLLWNPWSSWELFSLQDHVHLLAFHMYVCQLDEPNGFPGDH